MDDVKKIRKPGEKLPVLEEVSPSVKLDDDSLDDVAGGSGLTVAYYEYGYCPFCQADHELAKCQESVCIRNSLYPTWYCYEQNKYFFKASNGYFDMYDNCILHLY